MFADIIVDISVEALDKTYQYIVPKRLESEIRIGTPVQVPFGRGNRLLKGFVIHLTEKAAFDVSRMKEIVSIATKQMPVESELLQVAGFIRERYGSTMNEAIKTVIPIRKKVKSVEEHWLTFAMEKNKVFDILGEYKRRHYAAKVRLIEGMLAEGDVLNRHMAIQKYKANKAVIDGLVKEGIVRVSKERIYRKAVEEQAQEAQRPPALNEEQQEIVEDFVKEYREGIRRTYLLYGITGSGKTEVYIHLIEEILARGKQVLYLVPEIALTAQLSERLSSVFGKQLGVYHSRLSERERGEIYHRLQHGEIKLLLGVRSALFLAFRELGLIIVDEEHDSSYKQQDTSPRYHARTVAFYLARLHGAKVLLGSATPSIESYYNAMQGKIGLVKLMHRHNDAPLPHISLVDLKENYRRKEMNGHFAWSLIEKIKEQTGKHKQVIIFQNRRGYASQIECKQCGYVPKCVNCDVTLTVHQHQGKLVCHYCGYTIPIPVQCPSCGAGPLFAKGFGTEQIEDEVKTLFPEAKVVRMDLDTTRRKNAYQQILDGFANHEADVLIGTQMVSKGLHFPDVSLVAVLNADNLMNQPSFRSYEYAFQQLEQVSGRAGRQGCEGEVYIQTYQLDNPVFQQIIKHDYVAFYQQQIKERKLFKYPPFYRLLEVYIRHRDMRKVEVIASALQQQLFQVFGRRCSSVITPVISKLYNQYERRIMLKIEISGSFAKAKELLSQCIKVVRELPDAKAAIVFTDVEPL